MAGLSMLINIDIAKSHRVLLGCQCRKTYKFFFQNSCALSHGNDHGNESATVSNHARDLVFRALPNMQGFLVPLRFNFTQAFMKPSSQPGLL